MSRPIITDDVIQKIRRLERQNNAVMTLTDADLGPGAVGTDQIQNNAIIADHIESVNAGAITGVITAEMIGTINADQITGQIIAAQIASVSATTITGSITSSQIGSVAATTITGTITSGQIGSVAASTITGSITSAQIGSVNASAISGTITSGQIGSVNASVISGLITAAQIDTVNASDITGGITAGQITSVNASAISGSITAAQIASVNATAISGSITATQIGSVNATAISGSITSTQIGSVNVGTITVGTMGSGSNMLKNGSFENTVTPLDGWSLYNNALSPAPVLDTVSSANAKHIPSGATVGTVARITNSTDTVGDLGVVVTIADSPLIEIGKTYTGSAWMKVFTGGAQSFRVHIHWLDAANAVIGSGNAGALVVGSTTAWTRASVTATAPALAVKARMYVWVTSPASGGVYWFDALQFEESDIPTSYSPKPDEILPNAITAVMIGSVNAGSITGTITASQIGSVDAADITGTITAAQIGSVNAGVIAGQLTSGQIASVSAGTITGSIISTQIGSVNAGTITVGQLGGGGNLLYQTAPTAADVLTGSKWATQNGTLTVETTEQYLGYNTWKATSNAAGGFYTFNNYTTNHVIPAVPGEEFTFSFWVKQMTANRTARATIIFYDASFAQLGTFSSSTPVNTVGVWEKKSVTATAPALTARVRVLAYQNASTGALAAGEIYYIGGMLLEKASIDGTYGPRSDEVLAGSITAAKISVSTLSALSANMGTLTAGIIEGGTVRTGASPNPRVEFVPSGIKAYSDATNITFAVEAATGKVTTLAGLGGPNLLPNSSFEFSTAVAAGYGTSNATMAIESTIVKHGAQSVKFTLTSTGTVLLTSGSSGGVQGWGRAQVGKNYVASAWFYTTLTGKSVNIVPRFLDAADAFLANGPSSNVVLPANTWTRVISPVGTAPANTASVGIRAEFGVAGGKTIGDIYYMDAMQVEEGDLPTSYGVAPGEIRPDQVTGVEIATGAVEGGDGAGHIAPGSIIGGIGGDILADSITAHAIAADAIGVNELAANSVSTVKLAANAVTANKLDVLPRTSLLSSSYRWDGQAPGNAFIYRAGTAANLTHVQVTDSSMGGVVGRFAGYTWIAFPDVIAYDPRVLYRFTMQVRRTVAATNASLENVYVGFEGVGADGTTLVNITGGNTSGTQHYAVANYNMNTHALNSWVTLTGYYKGFGAPNGTGSSKFDPSAPGVAHSSVRYFRPIAIINYNGGDGTMEVDSITVDEVTVEPGQITTTELKADSVTATILDADAITAKHTITGATLQTGTSGKRVVINSAGLKAYAADGTTALLNYDIAAGTLSIQGTIAVGSSVPTSTLSGTVSNAQIASGITGSKISGALTSATIAGGAVTGVGTLSGTIITDGTITTDKIGANQITANKLSIVTGGGNMMDDSSFEDFLSAGYWVSSTGVASITQATPPTPPGAVHGTKVLEFTNSSTAIALSRIRTQDANSPKLRPGVNYTFSAYMRSTVAGRRARIACQFRTAVNANVGSQVTGTYVSLPDDGSWVRLPPLTTNNATSTVDHALIYVEFSVTAGGNFPAIETYQMDAVQVEEGDLMTAYSQKTSELLPGTITGVMIQADAIDGKTIVGANIRTGPTTGARVALEAATGIRAFSDATTETFRMNQADGTVSQRSYLPVPLSGTTVFADADTHTFEADVGNWVGIGGTPGSIARSTLQFHSGVASGLVTLTNATSGVRAAGAGTYTFLAGRTYLASIWARPNDTNADNYEFTAFVGSTTFGGKRLDYTPNVWQKWTVKFTPSANTTTFNIEVNVTAISATATLYIDDISIVDVTPAASNMITLRESVPSGNLVGALSSTRWNGNAVVKLESQAATYADISETRMDVLGNAGGSLAGLVARSDATQHGVYANVNSSQAAPTENTSVEYTLIDYQGKSDWLQEKGDHAQLSKISGQSCTSGTWTAMSFGSFDILYEQSTPLASGAGTMWSSGTPTRLTAPRAGVYMLTGNVIFAGSTGGVYRLVGIRHSDAGVILAQNGLMSNGFTNGGSPRLSTSTFAYFEAGEYAELVAYHDHGVAINIGGLSATEPMRFSMTRIGDIDV